MNIILSYAYVLTCVAIMDGAASPFEVVYLTGAPATGKSTLANALRSRIDRLAVWENGARLTEYLNRTRATQLAHADVRAQSSAVADVKDVDAVDSQLIHFVAEARLHSPVLIVSHAVNREAYGYRVTPFSFGRFAELRPTQIWVLFTAPEVTAARIQASSDGRRSTSIEQARYQAQLQASVAISYGMSLGVPVHFFDSTTDPDDLAKQASARIQRTDP